MIRAEIPEFGTLNLEHLVLDYTGTLSVDGVLLPRVAELLKQAAERLTLHVLTADTFGTAEENLRGIDCRLVLLSGGGQDVQKRDYVRRLGRGRTVCIGNGRNDALMVKETALGIAVSSAEGMATALLMNADLFCLSVVDALEMLLEPRRLIATLRNG